MPTRLVFLIFLSVFFYSKKSFAYTFESAPVPKAKQGVLDLRNQKFDVKIALDGEWGFYWNELLDASSPSSGRGIVVNFPFLWNGYKLNGKQLPGFGCATFKLTVLLPKTDKVLRIAMPDAYSAYRLFINGKQVEANGNVSATARGFVPHWQYRAFDLDRGTDTLKMVLQIANFVHSKGGIKKPIIIGEKSDIELNRQRSAAIDLMLTGCLFMGGLFFLGLYLLGNKDKAILMFSLYSIVYCYRIIGVDNYVLHSIFPNMDWYVTTRLEYVSLFLGVGLFGLYTRYLYPDDVNKTTVFVVNLVCFTFSAASLILPPAIYTQLINPFLLVSLFCIVYTPYVYFKAYQKKRPGSVYALVSSVALMSVFTIALLHYLALIPPMQGLSFAGYIGFFFSQSLVLSHRVSFELNKARQQAEQGLKTKSDFLSTMSHEIRTPLNSVIGMTHLLLGNDPRKDQVNQLDVMLFSANHLLAIVNDILDYNKIEAGKVTFEHIETDFRAIVSHVVTGLQADADKKGIELKFQVDQDLKDHVLGDPTRTFQVLSNLVHNAIKFTQIGSVSICVKVVLKTESQIGLKIEVSDTGIGISPKHQQIIFDRFTQADSSTSRGFGGTGLGLAICKRILELQGAKLCLHSIEGKGSMFYFTQTFDRGSAVIDQKDPVPQLMPKENKPFTGISILLVEDNPMNVMVAQSFLTGWGVEVDVAINGQEALDRLDVNRHRLVLMDLQMPVMDGYESAKKMRSGGCMLPIIALTANLPDEIRDEARRAGMNDIVIKPFLPNDLYNTIAKYALGR
jgi:signal transduction histidine kinase